MRLWIVDCALRFQRKLVYGLTNPVVLVATFGLKAIYDSSNFYLVHLDRKSGADVRVELEGFIKEWDNVR